MSIVSEAQTVVLGTATAKLNPLTNDWIVTGQNGGGAYSCKGWRVASQMLQSIDHFNKTGEAKAFNPKPRSFFDEHSQVH